MSVADLGQDRDRLSTAYVFGYGSLVDRRKLSSFWRRLGKRPGLMFDAELPGFHREWSVAMDNSRDLAGYKFYTDVQGHRPGYVAFLNIMPAIGGRAVNGLCFAVDTEMLTALDARERNYERIDVSPTIRPAVAEPVWCYVGSCDALARFRRGLERGTAVVPLAYRELIDAAFKAKGAGAYARYLDSTAEPGLPVLRLTRHEIPSIRPHASPRPNTERVPFAGRTT